MWLKKKFQKKQTTTISSVVVHEGVKCNHCGALPITGTRYKCGTCEDFNLCGDCDGTMSQHNSSHIFLQIKTPTQTSAPPPSRGQVSTQSCSKSSNDEPPRPFSAPPGNGSAMAMVGPACSPRIVYVKVTVTHNGVTYPPILVGRHEKVDDLHNRIRGLSPDLRKIEFDQLCTSVASGTFNPKNPASSSQKENLYDYQRFSTDIAFEM